MTGAGCGPKYASRVTSGGNAWSLGERCDGSVRRHLAAFELRLALAEERRDALGEVAARQQLDLTLRLAI